MRHDDARRLFEEFASAVVYVETEDERGGKHIGSAFHVGDGVFVTARHVAGAGGRITQVGRPLLKTGRDKAKQLPDRTYNLSGDVRTHHDPDVDVAVFQIDEPDEDQAAIRLGDHLDDWTGTSDFVMTEVVVLGYPPVPTSRAATLIAARGEVNGHLHAYTVAHDHFILSTVARGGFSGGVALLPTGRALGMVTQSLLRDALPPELGFTAVISVEPLYATLSAAGLLPETQSLDNWPDPWNQEQIHFEAGAGGSEPVARLELVDDGTFVSVSVHCRDGQLLRHVLTEIAGPFVPDGGYAGRPFTRQILAGRATEDVRAAARSAVARAAGVLQEGGLRPTQTSTSLAELLRKPPDTASAT